MEIIILKKNLAPIFENVITQKIKNNTKNQIIQDTNNNKNKITLVSKEENNKTVSIKKIINKSILFVRLYDKNLYLFLKKINFSPDGFKKPKNQIEPKSKEQKNLKINSNNTNTNTLLPNVNENRKSRLSKYGNGILKIITSLKKKNEKFGEDLKLNKEKSKSKDLKISLLINQSLNVLANNPEKKDIKKTSNIKKYLKSISLFNSELASYQNIVYQFNKSKKTSSTIINNNVFTLLEYSFLTMSSLISKPVFVYTSNKVLIQFFFYFNKYNFVSSIENKSKFLSLNKKKLNLLCSHISKFYRKPVELELNRLYYPYFDSNILSNMIGLISNIIKFRFIIKKLFFVAKLKKSSINNLIYFASGANTRYSLIPSFLSGIKIKLAGRLLTQRVIPRLTVKNIQRGTLARGKANFLNTARYTNKNKRGAYSITVTLGHIFF